MAIATTVCEIVGVGACVQAIRIEDLRQIATTVAPTRVCTRPCAGAACSGKTGVYAMPVASRDRRSDRPKVGGLGAPCHGRLLAQPSVAKTLAPTGGAWLAPTR